MPRDDLSIDFVKRMPQTEALDPLIILDDWINRVQNLPEEIRFIQDEIADKDRQYAECVRTIDDRDGKIQRWIKTQGSHENNPREDVFRQQIRESFVKAEQLAQEKAALTQKLQAIMDKHLRNLDAQIKILYDRAEPGFLEPDEVPSLLRGGAPNLVAPVIRTASAAGRSASVTVPSTPVNPTVQVSLPPAVPKVPNPQIRQTQQAQQHASSAPATPAASMILNRQTRESSAGPAPSVPKRGPRANSGLGSIPVTSSGLVRHSSLGPGTPKNSAGTGAGGAVRAGSAGPRASSTKGTIASVTGRKAGTPGVAGRKKIGATNGNKSSLSRVKKASNRNSPASTAGSELSDAEAGSGDEEDNKDEKRSGRRRTSGTPAADGKDGDGDEDMADPDDDEAGDDKKYCLCQNVSFGDMVACDNESCPFEWFHWSCVNLKSEPNGTWYCPDCSEKMGKKPK